MAVHRPATRVRASPALFALVVAAGAFLCSGAVSAPQAQPLSPPAQLGAARGRLIDNFALVQQRCRCAGSLQTRLDSELVRLSHPLEVTQQSDAATLLAVLENSLVDQLVAGQYNPLSSVHETAAILFRSKLDGSMQPLSVFVPAAHSGQKSAPLIVMLHGEDQSENELMSIPQLRQLAKQSGAVLAIPWARGDDAAEAAAASDVYDALDLIEQNFSIDQRRVYLAGLSLGGIALFKIGPQHSERWTAFLSIAGTITNDDMRDVARGMRGKQIFLVAGGNDTFVKPAFVKAAASWLAGNGVESHYYEQPGGEHSFYSLDPSIERAWRDMLSGVRMNSAPPTETYLPSPQPVPSQKN